MSYRYSTLQVAQQCPQRYKYQFVDKLPVPDRSGDMRFGTALHAGIQAILEGEDGLSVFQMFWESERDSNLEYTRFGWEELADQGETFLVRFKQRHAAKYKPVFMEETMKVTHHNLEFEGTADFIGEYDGKRSIVDFKTSRAAYMASKLITNPQLHLYAFLAKHAKDYHPEQLVYQVFVKGPAPRIQTLIAPFDDALMHQHMANLTCHASLIEDCGIYDVRLRNTQSCDYCPFQERCWGKGEVSIPT